ncbi:MAG: hypothetical protein RXR47_03375 [Nitrososphaeria archaeon]
MGAAGARCRGKGLRERRTGASRMLVVEARGSMRTSMEILGRSHGHLAE